MGFTEPNTSPLGLLIVAYQRVDKGTKCLFAPNDVAKRYASEFRKGTRDYLDDTLWWKAAQEEDQKTSSGGSNTTPVNTGDQPSDDFESYLNGAGTNGSSSTQFTQTNGGNGTPPAITVTTSSENAPTNTDTHQSETSTLDDLILRSAQVTQLSGKNYRFGNAGALNVRVYELHSGEIEWHGQKRPCFFGSDGIDCDFVYDPKHPLLSQYPLNPQTLLLIYLSEKLKARDQLPDVLTVFAELVETTMQDSKIDHQASVSEFVPKSCTILRLACIQLRKARPSVDL